MKEIAGKWKEGDFRNFMSDFESVIRVPEFLDAIDAMGVGLSIVDANMADLPLVYVNKGFIEMTGYNREEVLMRNCRFLQGPETDQREIDRIRQAIRECRAETVTLKNHRKDGSFFWNQFIISPILDEAGAPLYFVGLQFDITRKMMEEKEAEQRIKLLSDFDQLTGLMKLSYFKQLLLEEMKEESRSAVLRLNLKRFRNINNSYGERVSDQVLVTVADRLKCIFPDGLITRSFADEFIVFYRLKDSLALENALLAMETEMKKPYQLLGENVRIDFSIGISRYPEDGRETEALLSFAALAMREARKTSAVNYAFFHERLTNNLESWMQIERNFSKGIQKKEFLLHYQPKVSAVSAEITGMEALIRWNKPGRGLISPEVFIPIAEETGFIIDLGEWVLREACRTNKKWQDQGLEPVPMSVNVSAVQFMHPGFTKMVGDVLKETGLAASFLELEITETLLVNPELIIEKLRELKEMGLSVSIDDFGTGYSSIRYLKDLPVDTLKIDRTFIRQTPESERDNALLRSIIQLGKSLGLSVLAEGVESAEQAAFLCSNGCDFIQGYYFSKPLDEQAMEEKLKQGRCANR